MSEIALISNNEIINKIFTLVTKKLSLHLDTFTDDNLENEYKYIVVDDEIEIDIKKIGNKTDCIILISKEISNSTFYHATIKKPFLPSGLQKELEAIFNQNIAQKDIVKEINEEENALDEMIVESEIDTNNQALHDLVDNVMDSLENEETEDTDATISKESLGLGGVLDRDELYKLNGILNDKTQLSNFAQEDEEEWIELSKIVDRAIDELEVMANDEIKPINLQINKQNLHEVKPLLRKLNQEVIDSLVDGKEITLKLRLEQ